MSYEGDISNDGNVRNEKCVTQVFLGSTDNKNDITLTLKTKSVEKKIVAVHEQRTVSSMGREYERRMQQESSQTRKEVITSSVISQVQNVKSFNLTTFGDGKISVQHITDGQIEESNPKPSAAEVESAKMFYKEKLDDAIKDLKRDLSDDEIIPVLNRINEVIRNAWEVPAHGHVLGTVVSNFMRTSGALEFIFQCLENPSLQFSAAVVLEQCLTAENREYVITFGIFATMTAVSTLIKDGSIEACRIGTGILEHLFKMTPCGCTAVVRLGGVQAVTSACSKTDIEVLQHCSAALANLCLCGGTVHHEAIKRHKVTMWLTPLGYHQDAIIKYYSCLAMAALLRYKEFEEEVRNGKVLDDIETFLAMVTPEKFVDLDSGHSHGQGKQWLEFLLLLLSSDIEKVQTIAAFHFCVEAIIKKSQGETNLLMEIDNTFETLKDVASGSNPVAAKYATEALWLLMSNM